MKNEFNNIRHCLNLLANSRAISAMDRPRMRSHSGDDSSDKKGFTLVELSIVLVIIGLLIGGILVGQSLIDSAKICSTIQQIQQFDAAVMSFKSKYNSLPGDSRYFGGDGDARIEPLNEFTAFDGNTSVNSGETANFWAQAFSGKYAGGTYTTGGTPVYDPVIISGADITNPKPAAGSNNSAFMTTILNGDANYDNYYIATTIDSWDTQWWRPNSSANGNTTFKAKDLLSLDSKIDDAEADSGSVRSASYISGAWPLPSISPYTACSSSGDYITDNDDYLCTPIIIVGAQAGTN